MLSGSNPFAVRTHQTTVGSGFAWTYTGNFSSPVDIGSRREIWVAIRTTDTAGNRFPTLSTDPPVPGQANALYQAWVSRSRATFPNTPCIGSSVIDLAVDVNWDDVFNGSPGTGSDRLSYVVSQRCLAWAFATEDAIPA